MHKYKSTFNTKRNNEHTALELVKQKWINQWPQNKREKIEINGRGLTIDIIAQVAKFNKKAYLTKDQSALDKVSASINCIKHAIKKNQTIYGVNTNFGGLSHIHIPKAKINKIQQHLLCCLKAGTGHLLSKEDVRAGMLLRANSLIQGVSGVRLEIIERMIQFLNTGITPNVHEFGSIGASGDLIPLSYVGGALIGLNSSYKVSYKGKTISAVVLLKKLNMPRIHLVSKEALAIVNGTSMMTGIAANCLYDTKIVLHLSLLAHAFYLQALQASVQPFNYFIHQLKPHPGQLWSAQIMLDYLQGSHFIKSDNHHFGSGESPQDRYSIRCLAQYTGPIVDGLNNLADQIEIEANSATDNPLVDTAQQRIYHCGNFLGQYVGIAMDQLRIYLGLLAKHLDVQIASLVTPAFNNQLPPSLIGNPGNSINIGLKGLQICANSIMPILCFYGNTIVDRYPTHAEQYNQNINSQGYGASLLTRRSIEIMQQYLAIALLFGVQSVDLRTYQMYRHYDARTYLSKDTVELYEIIRNLVEIPISKKKAYVWNDDEQALDEHIMKLTNDIKNFGKIPQWLSHHRDKGISQNKNG